ncbi:MAG: MATE family efflux transporter [Candidatus Margulisbacteria bacterium]|nr:MATE family efflux transporter [Candidatus Margulisiibacteriota bacterium]
MIKRLYHKFKEKRDLTSGSIARNMFFLATPMIVSNLLQTTFELVNMFWVGRLGSTALAAVAMSGSIIMVVMFMMMGIGVGTTAMVARAIGAKEHGRAEEVVKQSLFIAFVGSFILAVLGYIVSAPLLRLLGASPEVMPLGTSYMHIAFSGSFVIFFMFLIMAVLQGAGDTMTPMLILAFSLLLNAILDPLLIFGLGPFPMLGVPGAALATIISRGIGCLIAFEVMLRGRSHIKLNLKSYGVDGAIINRILMIGFPASIQMTLRGLMGVVLMWVVAGFGTMSVAAYGIGIRLSMLLMMPGFALGMASATMVGHNLGAKKPERAVSSVWTAVTYYGAFMAVMGLLFFFFGAQLIAFFDPNPEVVKIGTVLMETLGIGCPFIALGLILDRSISGAGDTMVTMVNTFLSLWMIQIPLAIVLSERIGIGVNGVWYAGLVAQIVLAALNLGWFLTGRWKHKKA